MSWFNDYRHEIGRIKSGEIRPLYFLYGNDLYLRDMAVQEIRKAMKDKGIDHDYTYLYASEIGGDELQNLLFGASLFTSARCTVIHEVKQLLPSARKILNAYLKHPEPGNVLILTALTFDKRNAFYKRIESSALTLKINTPFENEIPAWIRGYLAEYMRKIDAEAINELLRYTGDDLGKLSNELDKLHIYLPENKTVNREDVRCVSGYSKTFSIEDLLQAVGKKDKSRAVAICKNLIENGVNEVYLIIALYQFVWKLIMLKDKRLISLRDYDKIVKIYKGRKLEQYKAAAENYRQIELKNALEALVNGDRRIKTTSCDQLSNFMITLDGIIA
ncbi:MAG: DNA polymerase III subunit delta [Fidelibacterota bacterium]